MSCFHVTIIFHVNRIVITPLYCKIPADVEYTHHRIVPNPNIAKAMITNEKIWEIPCQSIKLSELQDVTENKTVPKFIANLSQFNSTTISL